MLENVVLSGQHNTAKKPHQLSNTGPTEAHRTHTAPTAYKITHTVCHNTRGNKTRAFAGKHHQPLEEARHDQTKTEEIVRSRCRFG